MPEAIKDLGPNQAYSIAWILDPAVTDRLSLTVPRMDYSVQRMFSIESPAVMNGNNFLKLARKMQTYGLNLMFATLSGDIGYTPSGVFPERQNGII